MIVNDLMEIKQKYGIHTYEGLMPIPYNLCGVDDSPLGWWVIHLTPFKIGLRCLFPWIVAHALNTSNINLTQVDPNRWRNFLCILVIAGEHMVDLTNYEITYMYCLKRDGLDKVKTYISCVVRHGLHLKLPNSTLGLKDKYFYIIGDIWGDKFDLPVRYT